MQVDRAIYGERKAPSAISSGSRVGVLGRKVQTCVGTMDPTANKMFNSSRLYSARTSLLA